MPFYSKLKSSVEADRRTIEGIQRLKVQLDAALPPKDLDRHLLLATWNLREFGGGKYGGRTQESLFYIAEVMSRFDLIAVQEVRSDLGALDELMSLLGQSMWKYLVTDVTYGKQGNDERLAFIYDTRQISFGGLAGEVVPEQVKNENGLLSAKDGFARTPYIVGFRAGWFKFSICTMHSYYGEGEKDEQRKKEMADIVRLMKKRIESPDRWAKNTIILGDFNIFSAKDSAMQSLTKVFKRPQVFEETEPGSNQDRSKPYDQIGFLSPDVGNQLDKAKAGVFDPYESVMRLKEDEKVYPWSGKSFKEWRSYQISDHLPKWVQINVNFGDDYLKTKLNPPQTEAARARVAASQVAPARKKVEKVVRKKSRK